MLQLQIALIPLDKLLVDLEFNFQRTSIRYTLFNTFHPVPSDAIANIRKCYTI